MRSIRRDGPMTVAAFMELALYHPEHGYYASRARRSGRGGDFYTSVDVGSLFGEMLGVQVARMFDAIGGDTIDLVEAAAGNGRLMRDVLDALQRDTPAAYAAARVYLVERSREARDAQPGVLGPHAAKLAGSGPDLPPSIHGLLFANELLDAFPVHVVVRRGDALREVMVDAAGDRLVEREGPLSCEEVRREIDAGPPLGPDMRVEVCLEAIRWVRQTAARLRHGFLLLIDYGDDAAALRSEARRDGTLRAFKAHQVSGRWLDAPGEQDLTAHVDFSAFARAAEGAGLELVTRVEQAKWLLELGILERLQESDATLPASVAMRRRLSAKTLLVPGGIGSTHQVLVFRKRGQTHDVSRKLEGTRALTRHVTGSDPVQRRLPRYGLLGMLIMAVSEIAMLLHVEPFWSWHTPIAWTGYILFVDAWVWKRRGRSWLNDARAEFVFLAAGSVPLWLVFEWYNKYFLHNWHYVNLPENLALRYFGYVWSFATIWPALFETGELVSSFRRSRDPGAFGLRPSAFGLDAFLVVIGLALLLWPIVWPSPYLAAPVWLGFIFLLDPINRWLGAQALTWTVAVNLAVAGVICGIVWEFWNYWARTKWIYDVPILPQLRVFEMPVLGYGGFPAFALECFTMYVLLRWIIWRGAVRPISI